MLTRFSRPIDAALFVLLLVASSALALVAVAGSITHIGRTFPGFVVWDNLLVPSLGRPEWTGVQAGVPFRQGRIVAIDGVSVTTRNDLYAVVRASPPGTPHRYVFEGARGREELGVASMQLGWWDYAATIGIYVLNGLVFLVAGLAVFYLRPDSRQSRALLAFGTVWGLMLVLCADLFTTSRLDVLLFAFQGMCPAAILHFGLSFPEPRPPVLRSARPLLALYGAGLAIGLTERLVLWDRPQALLAVDNGVWLAIAVAGGIAMGAVTLGALGAATPVGRRRARVVLAGIITAFLIPLLALLALVILRQPISASLLTVTGFVFPLAIGYAIVRHDLFEADRFVKLSLVYAVLTGFVSLAYAGAVLLADRVAVGFALARSPFFPIAFVLVALVTIVPLRARVQRAIDRLFYRERVDYKDTVARATERLTTLLDREAIVHHVLSTLRDVLFLDGSVWERDDSALVLRGTDAGAMVRRIAVDDSGVIAFDRLGRMLSKDEALESPGLRRDRPALEALFERLQATLLIPLLPPGRPPGLLAVGRKASGGPLSADDVDVLRTLANQTAIALTNAAAVAQLQDARERLSRAEHLAAIGELSAAVAHGIRNPLAGIRLAAQLGLEHSPGPVRENLEDVLTEVDKLEHQVRGILDFARPFEPSPEPTPVGDLLAPTLETVSSQFQAAGISVAVDVPDGLPLLLVDRTHLRQALHELFANALDAMPHGGRLLIHATAGEPGRVRLRITDTGQGIPPDMRERIFRLFTTTKRMGTGVGLAVVRKILQAHGGAIVAEGGPDGASFVLDLPAA